MINVSKHHKNWYLSHGLHKSGWTYDHLALDCGNHYSDVIMGTMASQITDVTIVYSTVCSHADQRKHQNSASLALVWGIHRWPVNCPHKWPVTRKMFQFDDVIIYVTDAPDVTFILGMFEDGFQPVPPLGGAVRPDGVLVGANEATARLFPAEEGRGGSGGVCHMAIRVISLEHSHDDRCLPLFDSSSFRIAQRTSFFFIFSHLVVFSVSYYDVKNIAIIEMWEDCDTDIFCTSRLNIWKDVI